MKKITIFGILVFTLMLSVSVWGQTDSTSSITSIETALCTSIENRMPVGEDSVFSSDVGKVYLWCKVNGATDSTSIKHIWSYQGKEMAVVELPVKSPAWRTWSYKTISPQWVGDKEGVSLWEVKTVDAGGNILKSVTFKIIKAAQTIPKEAPKDLPKQPSDSLKG